MRNSLLFCNISIDEFDEYVDYISYEKNKIRNKKSIPNKTEHFSEIAKINITAPNGKFLFTDWDGVVKATKEETSTWEVFIVLETDQKKRLLSHDNLHFSFKEKLIAIKDKLSDNNEIEIMFLENNNIAFKTFTGGYLGVNPETAELVIVSKDITESSKFKWKEVN